jgi:hypothetical protein
MKNAYYVYFPFQLAMPDGIVIKSAVSSLAAVRKALKEFTKKPNKWMPAFKDLSHKIEKIPAPGFEWEYHVHVKNSNEILRIVAEPYTL